MAAVPFAGCTKEKTESIDALLAPYQEVIDKVNADIEPDFCIPDDQKENVYNFYKDYTLDEFEQELRDLYADASDELTETDKYNIDSDLFNLE